MEQKNDTRHINQVIEMLKDFKKLDKDSQKYIAGLVDGLKIAHYIKTA